MPNLIVCPMNRERDILLRAWRNAGFHPQPDVAGRLEIWRVPELHAVVSAGGIGKPQFALQTQHLLDTLGDCEEMVCAGTAGALAEDLCIGDVVIATATVEHDRKGRLFPKPPPRFECATAGISRLRMAEPQSFRIHCGAIASGDEDVVDAARRSELQQITGAVAVAWEGAGGARACAFSDVAFIEVRGITDVAGQDAALDFERNIECAMTNAAFVLAQWYLGST